MVTSLRLPVGCDALDPTGRQVLPHQLADDFNEFKLVVSKMHGDALMQRFYTPSSVKLLAGTVLSKVGADIIPTELVFDNVFPHIGAVRHNTIRTYAQNLLEYVSSTNREDIFTALQTLSLTNIALIPCTPANLLVSHCTDGRALAVANTRKVINESVVETVESLDTLIKRAMEPYAARLPKLKTFLADYTKRLETWTAAGKSLDQSKVINATVCIFALYHAIVTGV